MRQAQQKGKKMFEFKRNVKKELNDIWTEIHNHNKKLEKAAEWITSFETQLKIVKDEIKIIETKYGDTIHNHSVFKENIEKAIPTFNKMIENQNEMNKYIQGSTKLFQRIIKYIKLPKFEKKGD